MKRVTWDIDAVRSGIRDKSIKVLDARRPVEYQTGHIPTALNLPLHTLLRDDSPGTVAGLAGALGIDQETEVVVYDDTFGALASRVAWTLEHVGHPAVSLLEITYGKWSSLGLETDDDTPQTRTTAYEPVINNDILATHKDLDSPGPDAILLDNRERLNYLESHIPGAMNIPYPMLASPDGILRDPQDMRRIFQNRGIQPGSDIITYCGSVGTLSGLAYYALKTAGMNEARLYVRSFKEWKALDKPLEKQPDANYWDLSAE